jgi:hypothetical protein
VLLLLVGRLLLLEGSRQQTVLLRGEAGVR